MLKQILRSAFVCLLISSQFALTTHSAKAQSKSDAQNHVQNSVASAVQKSLNVAPADMFSSLKAIVRLLNKGVKLDSKRMDTHVRTLVQSLNRGADVDVMLNLLLPRIHIQNSGALPVVLVGSWPYGNLRQRRTIINYLWHKALAMHDKNAALYAKASVLLATQANFLLGRLQANSIVQTSQFAKISDLSQRDVDRLRKAVNRVSQPFNRIAPISTQFQRWVDKLSESKGHLNRRQVRHEIALLNRMWSLAGTDLGLQWQTANLAWILLNLAHARSDAASVNSLTSLLEKWKKNAHQSDVRRWLTEAVTVSGPPPGPMIFEGIMLPSGKVVPKHNNK